MPFVRRSAIAVLLGCSLVLAACGDPPDKEMQQAQGAIDAARAAGADVYAHDEYAAAQDALKRAHDAVTDRDYRLALNYALDSRERAQTAAKDAADHKAAARTDADRALTAATAALTRAQDRLKAAEQAKVRPRALATPRKTLTAAETDLQKARAAFDHGDYLDVTKMLSGQTARIEAVTQEVDEAIATAGRRRH
jgi:hypothetical protein